MTFDRLWPTVLTASAAAVAVLILTGVQGPVRVVLVGGFLLVCPGMVVVRRARLADRGSELVLAVAVSLGLEAVLAGAMLYAGVWSPDLALVILVSLCLLAGAYELVVTYRLEAAGARLAARAGTGGEP